MGLGRCIERVKQANERQGGSSLRPVACYQRRWESAEPACAGHLGKRPGALSGRLRDTLCANRDPNLGVRTIGQFIRYPDVLITCTRLPDTERLAPDVVVVFKALSERNTAQGERTRAGY